MYDAIVIGAGPAGIGYAYRAIQNKPDAKILIIEKGKSIVKRSAPCKSGKTDKCIHCQICDIMSGFGGAGAYSDGKRAGQQKDPRYHQGGNLHKYIGVEQDNYYNKVADNADVAHGASQLYVCSSNDREFAEEFDRKLEANHLFRPEVPIKHLGTSGVRELYEKYEKELIENGVKIKFNTIVTDIVHDQDGQAVAVKYQNATESGTLYSKNIVVAVGRSGSAWYESQAKKHSIEMEEQKKVDFGFRLEVDSRVMEKVDKTFYEAKVIGLYEEDQIMVRMFCTNPRGEVVTERTDGYTYVNGHADDKVYLSSKTNFAILVTYLSQDSKDPSETVRSVANRINTAADGQPIVQLYEDMKHCRATSQADFLKLNPTLKSAVAGDLSEFFPYKVIRYFIEYMDALGNVIPEINGKETIVYGPEAKFCQAAIKLDSKLHASDGCTCIGDGPGLTHGLAAAGSSGYYAADCDFPPAK